MRSHTGNFRTGGDPAKTLFSRHAVYPTFPGTQIAFVIFRVKFFCELLQIVLIHGEINGTGVQKKHLPNRISAHSRRDIMT
tara:strand:+ start:125 stop:367 length:243 start_codon:yes stop_codon:yes gene_type:complete